MTDFEVGEKVLEGFSVVYIQRIGIATVTTSYDKAGNYITSHRAEKHYIKKGTEKNLKIAAEAEAEYKRHEAESKRHQQALKALKEALE